MRSNLDLVAHPRGVYQGRNIKPLVCLTRRFSQWKIAKNRQLVANQNGPASDGNREQGLHSERYFAMPARHLAQRGGRPHTDLHKRTIANLLEKFPEVRTHGFWNAIRALKDAPYTTWLLKNDQEWRRSVKFVPDAYAVHHEAKEISIFEVVATSDITDAKIARIIDFTNAMDQDFYSVGLVRLDAYGPAVFNMHSLAIEQAVAFADRRPLSWRDASSRLTSSDEGTV